MVLQPARVKLEAQVDVPICRLLPTGKWTTFEQRFPIDLVMSERVRVLMRQLRRLPYPADPDSQVAVMPDSTRRVLSGSREAAVEIARSFVAEDQADALIAISLFTALRLDAGPLAGVAGDYSRPMEVRYLALVALSESTSDAQLASDALGVTLCQLGSWLAAAPGATEAMTTPYEQLVRSLTESGARLLIESVKMLRSRGPSLQRHLGCGSARTCLGDSARLLESVLDG
jgi:hypothetical protein